MSHFTFMNKGFRGFTLIELLVVIAIIGLLGTIVAGPINNARNKGKDAKKIADIKNIQAALVQYADSKGQFPTTLQLLVPTYLDALPANASSSYTPVADKYMYVTYSDAQGVVYGYHLGVKLVVPGNPALDNDADCTQNGGTACMSTAPAAYTNANRTSSNDPGAATTGGAATSTASTADFTSASVVDTPSTACTTAVTTCIYDVRGTL